MKKNVLIVGAGRRARATMIPAFWSMRDKFKIVSVLTKSVKDLSLFQDNFKITTINNLANFDLASIDIIATAIPVTEVRSFLKSFKKLNVRHITLILDTPVVSMKDMGTLKNLKNFKQVLIAEDFISLPQVRVIKEIIDSGKIGKLRYINISHGGFKHHALAMIKTITNASFLRIIKSKKYFGEFRVKSMVSNGVRVDMMEPRDYDVQRLLLVGSSGVISDYPLNYEGVYSLNNILSSNRYVGLHSENIKIEENSLDIDFKNNVLFFNDEISIINDQKIRGYMEIINSIESNDTRYFYSPVDAIYDNLAIKISDKLGIFIDIGIGNFSLFKSLIKIAIKILPR